MDNKIVSNIPKVAKEIIWADLVGIWAGFQRIYREPGALLIQGDSPAVFKPLSELEVDDSNEFPELAEFNKSLRELVKASLDANFCVICFFRNNKVMVHKVPLHPEERANTIA